MNENAPGGSFLNASDLELKIPEDSFSQNPSVIQSPRGGEQVHRVKGDRGKDTLNIGPVVWHHLGQEVDEAPPVEEDPVLLARANWDELVKGTLE